MASKGFLLIKMRFTLPSRETLLSRGPHWALDVAAGTAAALAAFTLANAALPNPVRPTPETAKSANVAATLAATPVALKTTEIRFGAPVAGYPVISPFGLRQLPWEEHGRLHAGVDIAAPAGLPVLAVADGVVTRAGEDGGFGRFVEVRHANGLLTVYAHLGSIVTRSGALVKSGETLGKIGSTGSSTGSHLHFEIRDRKDRPMNPELFMGRTFASAEALPMTEAARVPRRVRIAYVSYIPKSKRELMEGREAEKEETLLSKNIAARDAAVAKAVAAVPSIKVASGDTTAQVDGTSEQPVSLKGAASGRVHIVLDMGG